MTDQETILEIMRNSSTNSYLVTSVNNQPRARIVSPVIDDDLGIWIVTFNSSQKMTEIRSNPKIALTFNEYPNKGYREVQVFAIAEICDDVAEKTKIWENKKKSIGSFFKNGPADSEYALLKVKIDFVEWSDNTQGDKKKFKL